MPRAATCVCPPHHLFLLLPYPSIIVLQSFHYCSLTLILFLLSYSVIIVFPICLLLSSHFAFIITLPFLPACYRIRQSLFASLILSYPDRFFPPPAAAVFRVHHQRRQERGSQLRPAHRLAGEDGDAAGGDAREPRPLPLPPPRLHHRPLRCRRRRSDDAAAPHLEGHPRPQPARRGKCLAPKSNWQTP